MFQIDHGKSEPIYQQIKENFICMIEKGEMEPGEALPTIRRLASQLDIAINTVARAYQELENDGYIRSNGRKGSIVSRGKMPDIDKDAHLFKEPLLALIRKGYSREEIESVLKQTLSIFFD